MHRFLLSMKLFFIVLFVLIYFLVFPLKIKININNNQVKIYLYSLCIVDQEMFQALKEIQEVTIENIQNKLFTKEDLIYLNIIKKFKILKLDFVLEGFSQEFEFLPILYGVFYFLFSSFDGYFFAQNIPFSYKINYKGNQSFFMEGIFITNLGKILLEYFRLRRIKYGRTSN